jgi:predicted RND superfamily exporter protein
MLAGNMDEASIVQLKQLGQIVNALNSSGPISANAIADMTGIDEPTIKTILFFTNFRTDKIVFSDFVSSISKLTNLVEPLVHAETISQLNALNIMSTHIQNKTTLLPGDIVNIFGTMAENDMFTADNVELLYAMAQNKDVTYEPVSLFDVFMFLSDMMDSDAFSSFINDDMKMQFADAKIMMMDGKSQLVGPEYSRMIVSLSYKPDSPEIKEFYNNLDVLLNDNLRGDYYMVGMTAMAHEVESSFDLEYTIISIVTAIVVLLVVCISFRKFAMPLLLVFIIEFAVFAMMSVMYIINFPMYFIALILVQCILMGSMIDYAILLTTYYTEVRREFPVEHALPEVMRRATHAILTSSSILITVAFICGFFMTGQVANILLTLGVGALCAILLILFVLPACLTLFDKYLLKDSKYVQSVDLPAITE